jgi:hypothetical protein
LIALLVQQPSMTPPLTGLAAIAAPAAPPGAQQYGGGPGDDQGLSWQVHDRSLLALHERDLPHPTRPEKAGVPRETFAG